MFDVLGARPVPVPHDIPSGSAHRHLALARPLRIAVLTACPLTAAGLPSMMAACGDLEVVAAGGPDELRERVDVALVDVAGAPGGVTGLVTGCLAQPRVARVALFAWEADAATVDEALQAGAHGLLLKTASAEVLAEQLRRLAAGEVVVHGAASRSDVPTGEQTGRRPARQPHGLSAREAQMVALICQGWSNEQIARTLYLSGNSVKSYIRSAYAKMGVRSRSQAVIWGFHHGLRDQGLREQAALQQALHQQDMDRLRPMAS